MQKNTNVQTNEQIKKGKEILDSFLVGELNVLWKMLKTPTPSAARARLLRGSQGAIEAAEQIIKNREELISNYRNSSK